MAMVCALCCALGLVACGGNSGDDGKIYVQVAPFENDGVAWIETFVGEYKEDGKYEYREDITLSGYCYYNTNGDSFKYTPEKLEKGKKYYGLIGIHLKDDRYLGDGDRLILEINGKETAVLLNHYDVPEGEYFGRISVFSSDIEIKIKGTTTVKE